MRELEATDQRLKDGGWHRRDSQTLHLQREPGEAWCGDWHPARLRDWDCGGETARKRAFWTWPFMVLDPTPRPGQAQKSVMATTWKRGKSTSQYVTDKGFLPSDLSIEEYERLQGAPGTTAALMKAGSNRALAVHLLGNGVPIAMGRYIARAVRAAMYEREAA